MRSEHNIFSNLHLDFYYVYEFERGFQLIKSFSLFLLTGD